MPPTIRSRIKYAISLMFVVALAGALPHTLSSIGWMPQVVNKTWLVVIVTVSGMIIKSLISDMAAGEFEFHKFGFDNCILTLGGMLAMFVTQLKSQKDEFPSLKYSWLGYFDSVQDDIVDSRKMELFILFLFALVFTLITARNSAAIIESKKQPLNFGQKTFNNLRALINSCLGVPALVFYLYLLIVKEL